MKRRRHTPDQVIRKPNEGQKLLAEDKSVDEVPPLRGHPRYLVPLAEPVRGHEGRRRQEAQGAGEREPAPEEDRGGPVPRHRHVEGGGSGRLLTPELRRRVVLCLQASFGVSERRACTVAGQNRATQRKAPAVPDGEEQRLRAWLRAFSTKHPRWGWRRGHHVCPKGGLVGQPQAVQRLWRAEGLKVPCRKKKRPPLGIGVQVGAFCPVRPNVVWAMDFQFDQTADARTLKFLNVIDEFTRECLAIAVSRSIDADGVDACLDERSPRKGRLPYVRFDNGPEFIAHAVADWCRFIGAGALFIDPGSPWGPPAGVRKPRSPSERNPEDPLDNKEVSIWVLPKLVGPFIRSLMKELPVAGVL